MVSMSTGTAINPDWLPVCSIEQQFILALIGRQDSQRQQQWRELLPRVDWDRLMDLLQPQLYPYLHWCVETRTGVACCPPDVLRRLAGARRLTALQNLRRSAELRSILAAFSKHGIPVMLLKGIVLAHVAYGDASLRPMNDIDVLVHSANRERAKLLLHDLGYEWPDRCRGAHPALRPLLHMHQDSEVELGLQKRGTQILLEVHTQLEMTTPVFPVPVEEIWSRAVVRSFLGLQVPTLQAQDFLIHMCLHISRHHVYNIGLLPFLDILKWIETQGPWDWESFLRRPETKRYEPYISFTVTLARDLLGVEVPAACTGHTSDAAMKQIAWRQLWDDHRVRTPALVALLAEKSPADRARGLLNRLHPMYGCELGSSRGFAQAVRIGLTRILVDLKIKIPYYLKAFLSGGMSPRSLKRQVQLLHERQKLVEYLGYNNKDLHVAGKKAGRCAGLGAGAASG
jgi:putative nucleotidyltransferase-like protein